MKLPNHEIAIAPRGKIMDYLLSFVHKDGRAKAAFFSKFGFGVENWEVLAVALKNHAAEHDEKKQEATLFGIRYIIEGELDAPDGRKPRIRVVWFIESESDVPKLVTAYPISVKKTGND
ncbi:MAG: DUF6883 domain-containing protein [Pyrinomonadaceae bacterium]